MSHILATPMGGVWVPPGVEPGRCLARLVNHSLGWRKFPEGVGVDRCLSRLVIHPQEGGRRVLRG